jgi:Protein of unknown function (DUF3800)
VTGHESRLHSPGHREDRPVLLAYVDESGNTGPLTTRGASQTYTLGSVLIHADRWPAAFEELLSFRRRLKEKFGLPLRSEIKANYLRHNSGDLRSLALGPGARYIMYRAHLRMLQHLPARAFAIVVDKRTTKASPSGYFDIAWEALLQRLERTSNHEQATFTVVHDEGENDAIRKWVRRARRYLTAGSAFGSGSLQMAAGLLVDDPTPRRSHHSYFIQLTDLVAYAAFRAHIPPGRTSTVCPPSMWDEIGPATHTAVTRLVPRSRPGVVLR